MKTISKYTLILLLLFSTISFAQLENANWYFGNGAGLNFNGSTTVLNNGETTNMNSHTAVASNSLGETLFYTDGASVWNANHIKMINGNNTLNGGNKTVVIVPFPNNSTKYYIFTSKITNGIVRDYNYAIVNISNNLVEISNQPLYLFSHVNDADNNPNYDGVDRYRSWRDHMTVAKHADEESYWLLVNPFDKFFALKIDANGITDPIISDAEGHYNQGQDLERVDSGSSGMSISTNQDKVAYFTNYSGTGNYFSEIHLYTFNNNTGQFVFTNYIRDYDYNNANFGRGYSVEFSNNGNYLFAFSNGTANGNLNSLYQFNLNNISNNPFVYNISGNNEIDYKYYSSRLAIDGKIYLPSTLNSNILNVINNPDSFGAAANIVENQISLGNNKNAKLLPQLIPFHIQEITCQDILTITQDVQSNEVDIQEAIYTIIASNIIYNNANAEYDAATNVILSTGFHAKASSTFKAYIEGCTTGRYASQKQDYKKSNQEKENNLKLYPNPTNGKVTIESTEDMLQWELISQLGSTINKKSLNTNATKKAAVNLSSLPTGLYFIKITHISGEQIIKRIIKK